MISAHLLDQGNIVMFMFQIILLTPYKLLFREIIINKVVQLNKIYIVIDQLQRIRKMT